MASRQTVLALDIADGGKVLGQNPRGHMRPKGLAQDDLGTPPPGSLSEKCRRPSLRAAPLLAMSSLRSSVWGDGHGVPVSHSLGLAGMFSAHPIRRGRDPRRADKPAAVLALGPGLTGVTLPPPQLQRQHRWRRLGSESRSNSKGLISTGHAPGPRLVRRPGQALAGLPGSAGVG